MDNLDQHSNLRAAEEAFRTLAAKLPNSERDEVLPLLTELLAAGVDPNLDIESADRRCTMLSICSDGAIAQALIQAGARPHLVTQGGTTPYLDALKAGHMLVVAPMISHADHRISRSFVFEDEAWIEGVPPIHRRTCWHIMEAVFGSREDLARVLDWSMRTRPAEYVPRRWKQVNPFLGSPQ